MVLFQSPASLSVARAEAATTTLVETKISEADSYPHEAQLMSTR